MNRKLFHPFVALLALWLAVVNCNAPSATPAESPPETQSVEDVAQTAIALTFAAQTSSAPVSTEAPPAAEATAQPTACSPTVTATTNANVRSGPGTDYDVVGSLPLGGTATVAGRNDANTWWYIDFPGGAGGHAWIAGSVTTTSCLPAVVAVIAAPPLPSAPAADSGSESEDTEGEEEEEEEEPPAPAAKPDLVASGMQVWPDPATQNSPIDVMVRVTNQGDAASGNFSVQWWATWAVVGCNWSVPSMAPGETRDLECSYTYSGWANYAIKEWVDPGGLVDESNEGNNTREDTLQVQSD